MEFLIIKKKTKHNKQMMTRGNKSFKHSAMQHGHSSSFFSGHSKETHFEFSFYFISQIRQTLKKNSVNTKANFVYSSND